VSKSKSCNWRGMVARGVYKPACSTPVMGIPPRAGDPCPGCGRPVIHWRPKTQKRATMADYLKWKRKRSAPQHSEKQ